MTSDTLLVLKAICKELHEMNKKLDRFGQASIFNKESEIHITYEIAHGYEYEEDNPLPNRK